MTRQEDGRFGLEVDAETDKLMRRAAFASTEHRYDLTPTPTDAESQALIVRGYGPGYDAYRNKWIGDHADMIVDLVIDFVPREDFASLSAQIEELRAENARLLALVERVRAAIEFVEPAAVTWKREAIATDLRAGMSLRKVAEKHSATLGVVRGVARQALGAQP